MLAVSVFHLRNNLPSRCIYIRTLTSSAQQAKDDVIRRKMLEKIIRVDHAGELGASYIYKGDYFSTFIVIWEVLIFRTNDNT